MRKNNRKSKNGNRSNRNFPVPPLPSAVSYSGKIPSNTSETGTVVTLRNAFQLTTNGAGFVNSTQNADVSAFDNFSEYSTIFQDYRTLGIRYEYYPNFAVNSASVGGGLMVHCILHTEITPSISNITEAYSYGDSRVGNVFKPWKAEWRMAATDEAEWLPVTSSGSHKAITITIDQAGASIAYGVVFVTALVQFRTTRK